MTITLHSAATLSILPRFAGLKAALDQAETLCTDRKINPSVILNARLSPDMLSLTNQVQLSSDHAKGSFYRTAGVQAPSLADNESSFAELHARIDKTLELIKAITPEQMNGREDQIVELKIGGHPMQFSGHDYLLGFALPNFYFHVVTAYAILRENGVPLGKTLYMGRA